MNEISEMQWRGEEFHAKPPSFCIRSRCVESLCGFQIPLIEHSR
jgi:hypothetical protein